MFSNASMRFSKDWIRELEAGKWKLGIRTLEMEIRQEFPVSNIDYPIHIENPIFVQYMQPGFGDKNHE